MTTLRIFGLSICLLLSLPPVLAERGFTGLRIGPNSTAQDVFPNAPAWQAGIRPGDVIEYVDNISTRNMQPQELSDRITGPMGTKVTLIIVRGGKRYTCVVVRGSSKAATEAASAAQQATAHSDVGVYTGMIPVAESPSNSPAQAGAPPIVAIEIFKQSSETDKTLKQVKEALSKVPLRVQEALKTAGIEVLIVPNIYAVRPELAQEKPRGYHEGGYDNCAGLFYPQAKKVYICEKVSYRNSPGQENWLLVATALHEIGHAYDFTGSFSKADSFIKAYVDDGKHLGNEQRNKYEYFLQENEAGHSEMFAELFHAVLSARSERAAAMTSAFPRCSSSVREAVGTP